MAAKKKAAKKPLTRAADKKKTKEMTPEKYLSKYGTVSKKKRSKKK